MTSSESFKEKSDPFKLPFVAQPNGSSTEACAPARRADSQDSFWKRRPSVRTLAIFCILMLVSVQCGILKKSDGPVYVGGFPALNVHALGAFSGWRVPEPGAGPVGWKTCGDGFQCANVSLPLDYHNLSDTRSVTISVARFLATNATHRLGSVFINPGGPGGSGTSTAFTRGPQLSRVLQGRYDIIGFDPRGVNQSRPYLSCFESQLDADTFASATVQGRGLNLPVNFTSDVKRDLAVHVNALVAEQAALAAKCLERTGDVMAYFGTEAVVRDIDALSKLIEGEDARINYWGFSYGTIIGQYLIKVLSPDRIGRVIIDGVVNPELWSSYPPRVMEEGLDNIEDVLESFAESCSTAGDACALSHLKPREILSAIDNLLEDLYHKPLPISDLRVPEIATAANLRALLFSNMYKIQTWPDFATHLDQAFKGNLTGVVNATAPRVDGASAGKPDDSRHSTHAIFCSDSKPFSDLVPAPTNVELADYLLDTLNKYSTRMGQGFFSWSPCHLWHGVTPRKSRYEGSFGLENGTLYTPILVLSQTYDPVTSLGSAIKANKRLGDNARLVQQTDGWGHCTISQKSFCTAEIVQAYMLHGKAPEEKHTLCKVDELPFMPFNDTASVEGLAASEEVQLRKAWIDLTNAWTSGG